MKPGKTGIYRMIDATGYSVMGLKSAWKSEAAFRQECVMAFVLVITAYFIPVTSIERILMIGSLGLVLIVELLNSAIEAAIDRIGDEWHVYSKKAKDIGSSSVLFSIVLTLFVWVSCVVNIK
ncbi:diacylglycerol kinase [Salinivibrio costicola]|uniref:Diacylglycerol kinase n=1 Tax=Salinivibrio costicola TaxID=51367 RepID=A0ABX6K868_SALCS|nr:diacylglycerol kinase [Salinivibrio costicola]QIR07724.1 diacylglycerol kinase [Salinivibrio costicola]